MKLYDSKEISAILKKAAENSSEDTANTPTGLSLDELRQVASEVGIDPKHIESAVAEIESESNKSERNFWGGPFTYNSQVLVDGEISAGQWEEMIIEIRNFFQSNGDVKTRESVLEWTSPWGSTNSAQVTALKDKGKTKISLNWNGPLTAIPYYIPVPLVAIASLFFASEFLALTAVPGIVFTLLATGLTFLAGRWKLRKQVDKGFKKLQKLIGKLDLIASRDDASSTVEAKQQAANKKQHWKDDSLKNILIEEDQNEPEKEMKPRNRSKT